MFHCPFDYFLQDFPLLVPHRSHTAIPGELQGSHFVHSLGGPFLGLEARRGGPLIPLSLSINKLSTTI
jgi:hypothetical protein